MAQSLTTKLAGLYTFQNDLSEVPEGALSQADNIVIDRDGEAEPRRGLDYMAHGSPAVQSAFSDPTYRANRLFFYQNQVLTHYDTNLLAYHNATTGWSNYSGSFAPPSASIKVRSAQANQNFYFTTSLGVQKIDSYMGTPAAIGAPPALDVTTTLAANVTPTATTVNGNATINTVSSVTGVAVGMSITGTGIPANTTIVSFTANTITLSVVATASNSGVTMTISAPATWLTVAAPSTAYRVLWGIKDANMNLILGAPSQQSQITNTTASAAAVIVNFSIPAGITTTHFYQIYRSSATSAAVTPNDEMQLVYEGNPIAADLTLTYISVVDITPDSLRGATIYTAQSQEGLANENAPPPLANDLAVFKNCMFFGNTSGLQSYSLTLLGVGTPTGIQSGDTVTVGGIAYTAGSSENVGTATFQVYAVFSLSTTGTTTSTSATLTSVGSTTGVVAGQSISGANIPAGTFVVSTGVGSIVMSQAATGNASGEAITITGDSTAQAIRDTALSLVRVVNRHVGSTTYAYYLSGPTDLPGLMLIQSRTVGAAAFPVVSSRTTCWSPALPTSGTTQSSTNGAQKNGLYYSKVSQPEAVPIGNYLLVGSADKAILRVIALRDSLFILKEDGIYRLYGSDPSNFQVSPLDYTAILIAPDSAVAINNQIYAFTTQGVVAIGEQGVQIMSHPIESDLTSLVAANYSLLQTSSFGVAYESDRAYYLFCISNGADTGPTQYYRYNYITNTWTRGTLAKTCGAVNPFDNKLYLGNAGLNIVDIERKALTYSDYADYQSTQTITLVVGTLVAITSSDTIAVGSIIFQSAEVFGTVASVDPIGGTVTTTLATALTAAAADVLAPISTEIAWIPETFANAGMSHQIREVTLIFKRDFNGTAQVGFSSDITPEFEYETIAGGNVGGWGLFAWGGPGDTSGGAPWGGDPRRRPVRIMVPRNHQRSSLLTTSFSHSYGFSPWLIQGISRIGDVVSERSGN